jgi:hypothetical protein
MVLLRTGAQALIRTLGARKGRRFINEWASLLSSEESVALLFPNREPSERAAVRRAQRGAIAWFNEAAPALIASVPPE